MNSFLVLHHIRRQRHIENQVCMSVALDHPEIVGVQPGVNAFQDFVGLRQQAVALRVVGSSAAARRPSRKMPAGTESSYKIQDISSLTAR